jgi:hypothetical protein
VCRSVLDRVPKGAVEVILSYCHHSLNDTSLLELVPYLQEKGVGLISASPLALGLFSGKGWPDWHFAPPELKVCTVPISRLLFFEQTRAMWNSCFVQCFCPDLLCYSNEY